MSLATIGLTWLCSFTSLHRLIPASWNGWLFNAIKLNKRYKNTFRWLSSAIGFIQLVHCFRLHSISLYQAPIVQFVNSALPAFFPRNTYNQRLAKSSTYLWFYSDLIMHSFESCRPIRILTPAAERCDSSDCTVGYIAQPCLPSFSNSQQLREARWGSCLRAPQNSIKMTCKNMLFNFD